MLAVQWHSRQTQYPLVPGNPTATETEQRGASSPPAHTSLSHTYYSPTCLFIILQSMMLQTQKRCVIKRRLFLVGRKAYVPAHNMLCAEFSKTPQPHPLALCLTSQQGISANRMFLGSIPVAWRKLSLEGLCGYGRAHHLAACAYKSPCGFTCSETPEQFLQLFPAVLK